jgi:hypothetical protein
MNNTPADYPSLIEAFNNFGSAPATQIEYRLYYETESGRPIAMGSSRTIDAPYIVITKDIYDQAAYNNLRVVDGKLVTIDNQYTSMLQLKKTSNGEYSTAKNNASVLITETEEVDQVDHYERKYN